MVRNQEQNAVCTGQRLFQTCLSVLDIKGVKRRVAVTNLSGMRDIQGLEVMRKVTREPAATDNSVINHIGTCPPGIKSCLKNQCNICTLTGCSQDSCPPGKASGSMPPGKTIG